jgi:hypothetical protein
MVGTRSLSSGAHSRDPLALLTLQSMEESAPFRVFVLTRFLHANRDPLRSKTL